MILPTRLLVTLALALFSLLPACGAGVRARTRGVPRSSTRVEMDPIRIQAHCDASGALRLEAYDADSLFQGANRELSAGRCERAVPACRTPHG